MRRIGTLIFVLGLSGCVNIPPEAIALNTQVSSGVAAMERGTGTLIDAWREMAVSAAEAEFDSVYGAVEERYRATMNLPAPAPLDNHQLRDVAALTLIVNQDIWERIATTADAMHAVNRSNGRAVRGANDSITGLLESAQRVGTARRVLLKDVGSLSPLTQNVTDFIAQARSAALGQLD